MSRPLRELSLMRHGSSERVAATLLADLTLLELLAIERQWHSDRTSIVEQLLRLRIPQSEWPQSWHWDWGNKLMGMSALTHAAYAVMNGPSCLGVMLVRLDPRYRAKLAAEAGKELAYLDFIENAPSNWSVPALGQRPSIKGVGTALVLAAIGRSVDEEWGGRLGLHSLPQSERFYDRLGMTRVGPDPMKQGLTYFELGSEQAKVVLTQGGWT